MKKKYCALLLFVSTIAFAQNTGVLKGRIVDAQNQLPLEGATVVVVGTAIGVVTDQQGYFTLENIPTKTYSIEASYLGYETQTLFNVIVKSVGNIPLYFELGEF